MTKSTCSAQQQSFSQIEYEAKKKLTRRDIFLAKMESVVPWSRLLAVIEPHYPMIPAALALRGVREER